jgi:hypothetical protein
MEEEPGNGLRPQIAQISQNSIPFSSASVKSVQSVAKFICGRAWLWALSLFLVGLGAKLWLIQRFGTPLPFWDQWEEARVVYLPYFEGKLSLADLFSAHNEHRIFFTRIYGLGLLLLNGQWDGQLQMVANAIIHCATLAGLGWLMFRWLKKRYWILVWLPLALVLVLPFGWENSLAGFQSQFYFLVGFSLLTLWLLGLSAPRSPGWWCGTVTAVMALFTVASGFLAAAAVFALVVLRVAKRVVGQAFQPAGSGDFPVAATPSRGTERGHSCPQRRPIVRKGRNLLGMSAEHVAADKNVRAPLDRYESPRYQEVLTLAFCSAVILSGLWLKADVRFHHIFQAHSVGEFLTALGGNLAWPWIVVPPFAVLNLLPLATLVCIYLKDRKADRSAAELTLVIGMWAILQAAATAYARGADGRPPGWRYMDSSSFILVANCFSIAVLLSRSRERTALKNSRTVPLGLVGTRSTASPCWRRVRDTVDRVPTILPVAFILWAVACGAGLALLTMRAWQIDIPERHLYYRAQLQNARAFMATDEIRTLDHKPRPELAWSEFEPDPHAPPPPHVGEKLGRALRDPRIREILPACARQPLEVRVDQAATRGFVTNGFRLTRREPPTEVSWGSCIPQRPAQTASFESLPIQRSRLPYLEISVAGDLGRTNISLELIDLATGKRMPVSPAKPPGEKWLNCYVKAPVGEFKLAARNPGGTNWFAFKAPREVGRLSFWAVQILMTWKYLLFAGVGLLLLDIATFRLGNSDHDVSN